MKVLIDETVAHITSTGTAHYIRNLVKEITCLMEDHDSSVDVRLIVAKGPRRIRGLGWIGKIINMLVELVWIHIVLPFICLRKKIDVLHMPANVGPLWAPCPVITTIHDLTFLKHGALHDRAYAWYAKIFVGLSATRSTAIITPSRATAKDVRNQYRINEPGRVIVTYLGLHNFYPDVAPKVLDAPYILYVGAIEPHKNLLSLIQAYELSCGRRHFVFRLVLAGSPGRDWDNLNSYIRSRNLQERVLLTGRISVEDLAAWYKGAHVFILPSLSEGFGFPVLEAMAYGLPILCSNVSSLPEIAGDACMCFEPTNLESISMSLDTVLLDDSVRSRLVESGRRRIGEFTWRRTAQETISAYAAVSRG